ncbi:MAG: DUF1217 domain-containing protein [Alphaproteobacteria bacterium]|nr:DUF1217 domain-containing protein [Alphaproteobacteria bacterium]
MVASLSSLSIATSLLASSASQTGFDFTKLYPTNGSGTSSLPPAVALQQAEDNESKQLDQVRKDPQVQKDLARYAKVVAGAKTLDDVLDDPVARQVFLKANGLGDQVDYVGLAKKALASDPSDTTSLANKLSSTNGNWLSTINRYNLNLLGVTSLRLPDSLQQVSDDYVSEKRLDNLDNQLPGLGSAILFKALAPTLTSPLQILGSALGREVVTTALGLPKEIAIQSLEAQEKAISQRLDVTKLQNPAFVDNLIQRYLIENNSSSSSSTGLYA